MILITGASGFIGKHLLEAIIDIYGYQNVIALTSKPMKGANYVLHHNYQFNSNYLLEQGCREVEVIIHAGAFTPKNSLEANQIHLCNSNILNTLAILNSELPSLKKIIYLSTLDIYSDVGIISEETRIAPITLYGYSKLYCEEMINSWATANNIKSQILRIGHVFGPGEEMYQKLIPVTIKKILNSLPVEIYDEGTDIRSFIYIKDVVKAIINSISLTNEVGPINIVSTNQIKIKDVVHKLINFSNTDTEILYLKTNKRVRNLVFDNTKMKTYLLDKEEDFDFGLEQEWLSMKTKYDSTK